MTSFFRRPSNAGSSDCMGSEHITTIQSTLKELRRTPDLTEKQNLMMQFLISFDNFIVLESIKPSNAYLIPNLIKEMLENSNLIDGNVPLSMHYMKVLSKLYNIAPFSINPHVFCNILVYCCKVSKTLPKILTFSQSFFEAFLKKQQFFTEFSSTSHFEFIFNNIFIENQDENAAKFVNSLLFNADTKPYYKSVNFMEIFQLVGTLIKDNRIQNNMAEQSALFIATMFQYVSPNSRQITKFFNQNSLIIFDIMVSLTSFELRTNCYKPMLYAQNEDGSSPPNLQIFKHLYKIFSETPPMQQSIVMIVCELIEKIPESTTKLDSIIPIQNWMNWNTPILVDISYFLVVIDKIQPKLVLKCLPIIFNAIIRIDASIDSLIILLQVLQSQISKKYISYNALLETNFLSAFIVQLPSNLTQALYTKYDHFSPLVLSLYSLEGAISFRPSVFKSVMILDLPDLNNILTQFISMSPDVSIIKMLLDYIEKTGKLSLLQSLNSVLVFSPDAAVNFVACNGIDWAFANLQLENLVELLAALVCTRRFDELEKKIESLKENHPLLKASQELLEKVIFGLNVAQCRPIRVHSLVHLLDKPMKLDPYNAWLLGSAFIEQSLKRTNDIFAVPMIDQIANRFLQTKYLKMLLERPYDLERFVNTSFDHFQLYQFYPGNTDLFFDIQFVGLSFWFRSNSSTVHSLRGFKTDVLNLTLDGSKIMIQCEDTQYSMNIDLTKWNFVALKLESTLMSTSLALFINGRVFTFQLKQKRNLLTSARFCAASKDLILIGPAIRFTKSPPRNYNDLYNMGPHSINSIADDEIIVTPNGLDSHNFNVFIPPNLVCVPYFGFPMHFLSNSPQRTLLAALGASQNAKQFGAVFHTLLNIQDIMHYDAERFYWMLIGAFTNCHPFMSRPLFMDFLDSSSKNSKSEGALTSILLHKKMWDNVNNDILVDAIFERFEGIDFHSVANFEIFLTKKIMDNKAMPAMITSCLNNISKLPSLKNYLRALLKIGSVEIQNNIIDALTNFIDKKNFEIIIDIAPFNSLLQISLLSDVAMKAKIIHLMSLITSYKDSYIVASRSMLKVIAMCIYDENVWKDVIVMADQSHNTEVFQFAIVMVCVGASAVYRGRNELFQFVDALSRFLLNKINFVIESERCVTTLCSWLPLCLNIKTIKERLELYSIRTTEEKIPKETFEIDASNWSNYDKILGKINVEIPSEDVSCVDFLIDLLDCNNTIELKQIPSLILFINQFLIMSNQSTSCIFLLGFSTISKQRSDIFIRHFIINVFNYILTNNPKQGSIQDLFISLLFLSNSGYLSGFESDVFLQLLTYINSLLGAQGDMFSPSMATIIDNLLQNLFIHLADDKIPLIVSHIVSCFKAFTQLIDITKSIDSWYYLLMTAKANLNMFNERIAKYFPESMALAKKGDFGVFEAAYKSKSMDVSVTISSVNVRDVAFKEINQLAIESHKTVCIAKLSKQIFEELMFATLSSLNSEFIVLEEMVSWTSFIAEVKDAKSDIENYAPKAYTLSPRSYPFLPPRLLTPCFFSKNDVEYAGYTNKAVAEHPNNMMDLFLKIHNSDGSPLFKYPIVLTRNTQNINCVVFFFQGALDIITFATFQGEVLTLLEISSEITRSLLNEAIQGDWGSTSIFAGRIVIHVKHSDLIYAIRTEDSYVFWGFGVGSFRMTLLPNHACELQPYINKLCEKCLDAMPPFPFIHRVKSIEEALQKFANGWITASDTMFIYNALTGRFFINYLNQPIFPNLDFPHEILDNIYRMRNKLNNAVKFTNAYLSPKSTVEKSSSRRQDLARRSSTPDIFTLHKSSTTSKPAFIDVGKIVIDDSGISPLDIAIPELLKGGQRAAAMILDKIESEKEINSINSFCHKLRRLSNGLDFPFNFSPKSKSSGRKNYSSIHSFFTPQVTNIKAQNVMFEIDNIKSVNPSTQRLYCTRDLVFELDNSNLSIVVKNIRTNNIVFRRCSPTFVYASGLAVSDNGLILIVDYEFCLSRSFRVKYEGNVPVEITSLSALSLPYKPVSDISGFDCIGATVFGRTLVLWEVFSGAIHRKVELSSKVVCVKFDENSNCIWIITVSSLVIISINGAILIEKQLKQQPSAISVFHLSNSVSVRAAIIGFINGAVSIVTYRPDYSTVEIKELQSPHLKEIVSIAKHQTKYCFTTSDVDSTVVLWTPMGSSSPRFKHDILSRCPICGSIASEQCTSCSRICCKRCCMNNNCLLCTGLSYYV